MNRSERRASELAANIAVIVLYGACAGWAVWMMRQMGAAMPMPGGWTMSMVWMRMPGQTPIIAAGMFAAMWAAMMVAMMLPSTWPMIRVYQHVARFRGEPSAAALPVAMAAAYFVIWTAFGLVVYGVGLLLAASAMHSVAVSRSIPMIAGAGLIVAGVYQITPWKMACLSHCRDPLQFVSAHLRRGWWGAVRLGLQHGAFCVGCCWALMLVQLVFGVMSLPAMIAIAGVIAAEKLLPRPQVVRRFVGAGAILVGMLYIARDVV